MKVKKNIPRAPAMGLLSLIGVTFFSLVQTLCNDCLITYFGIDSSNLLTKRSASGSPVLRFLGDFFKPAKTGFRYASNDLGLDWKYLFI